MAAQPPLIRFLLRFFLGWYRWFALLFSSIARRITGKRGTPAEERVVSGQAWDEFCDTLKAAGASMVAPGAPRDAFTQAEGYRYLARLARAGLENFLECSDVEAPTLCAIANGSRDARVCIGSDNPDNLYENAQIDGTLEYVLTGTRGTVRYLGFGTQSGQYGKAGGLQTVAYLHAEELAYDNVPPGGKVGATSTFTIVLSAERPAHAKNWLQLKPEPREAMCIVRQTFGDRTKEMPAAVTIRRRIATAAAAATTTATATAGARRSSSPSRTSAGRQGSSAATSSSGAVARPRQLTAERLDEGLQSAAVLVAGASAMFAKWAYGFQGHTNQLPLFDQKTSDNAGGDPNIRYYHSYWRLPASGTPSGDWAMVITAKPPPCRMWNFQLNNHWMESLDYRHHVVHTNSTLARPDEDGSGGYTIIVCAHDPHAHPPHAHPPHAHHLGGGRFLGNWLETTGHEGGTMCFRWVAPQVPDESLPHPKVEILPVKELLARRR